MISSEQASSSEEMDLGALWGVLWSYRYVIGATTAVCIVAAVILALVTKPVYRAEAVITEVRDGMDGPGSLMGQLGGLASLAGVNLGANSAGREFKAFLQSRSLVEAFIKQHDLLPVLYAEAKKPPTMWLAVKKFRDGILSIREDARKGIITVSVSWTDAAVAARWSNDLIALVNELLRNRAIAEAKRNIAYLNDQIASTKVVELQHVMYNLIESETKTLMLANVRIEYAFEVVDPAVAPEIRIRPKRTLMVVFGAVLGFLIGAIGAFAHNTTRRKRNV